MKRLLVILLIAAALLSTSCLTVVKTPENPLDDELRVAETVSPVEPSPRKERQSETPEQSPAGELFQFTPDNMPLIDGSTATIPLIEAVYSVLLGIPREEAAQLVSTSGTDNAYANLIGDYSDVKLLLVYSPSPASLDAARSAGVELEMAPIGRDGLVFLVNKANPVKSLTPEQIVSIYTGDITSWSAVGGDNTVIKAFQRPYLSGSQTMMDALVMKGTKMVAAEPEYIIGEMGGLIEAVAAYDNAEGAIGYNVFYFVTRMEMNENVRLLSVGGVAPSVETISDGSYPFVSDFYAVIRADAPEDSPERILFNWIQTGEGRELVKHEGYATADNG